MLKWEKFHYENLEEVRHDIRELSLNLPLSEDMSVLAEPLTLYGKAVKNRIAIQPMEGFDGFFDGTPKDFTFRKYRKFSEGGAGIIWFESFATSSNSKTCQGQLRMNEENLPFFKRLIYDVRECAADGIPPFTVCQLTYCGRGSNLDKGLGNTMPQPIYIACENPYLPRENTKIITDDEIKGVIDDYVKGAKLAKLAGFDAVDVRACHGYFLNEILSAFTREHSQYGGSFENRIRMMTEIIDRINEEVGIPVATRLNACDLIPYPYGWGMKKDGSMEMDMEEPLKLIGILREKGVRLFNISLGRNHVGHIQCPGNTGLHTEEHQLVQIEFFQRLAGIVKENYPDCTVMTGNFSWTRQFTAHVAAGGVSSGRYDLAGFAKMALAYPEFANDIIREGKLKPEKCCIGCGMCGALCAASSVLNYPVGCVKSYPEIYMPYYKSWISYAKASKEAAIDPLSEYPMRLFDFVK